ncbi:MAG: hypothetical protein ACOY3X_07735 [Pseudomonadota bacterium]
MDDVARAGRAFTAIVAMAAAPIFVDALPYVQTGAAAGRDGVAPTAR